MPHLPFPNTVISLLVNGISFILIGLHTFERLLGLGSFWCCWASLVSARRGQRRVKYVVIVWKGSDENKYFSVPESCWKLTYMLVWFFFFFLIVSMGNTEFFCFALKNCLHQRRNKVAKSFSLISVGTWKYFTQKQKTVTESVLTVSRVKRSDEGLEYLLRAHEISI